MRSDTASCLNMRRILHEDVWYRVGEARREVHVVVAQLRRVVAKEVAVEALSEASLLVLNKHQRVDGERGRSGHDGLLDGICLLALGALEDGLAVWGVTTRTLRSRTSAITRGCGSHPREGRALSA